MIGVEKAMMQEIVKAWGIDDCPKQIYHSVWSVKESFVLKEYSDKNALQRNIQMQKILSETGVPVPEVCLLIDGKEFYEKDGKMYLLTTKLKGKNIVDIDKVSKSWFFNFGQIIARLHEAFRECEKKMSFWNNSLLEEMEGWVTKNLDEYKPEYISKNEITESIRQLSEVYGELPKQLIHRDVHLGNFLFDEMQFSGYIDFDLSQSNIRIFDLCYFLLGLLIQENKHRVKEECWFEIISQVLDGYDSLANLSLVERRSVSCVMKNIELLFVSYFLGIGEEKLAKESAELFLFVSNNEKKILNATTISASIKKYMTDDLMNK